MNRTTTTGVILVVCVVVIAGVGIVAVSGINDSTSDDSPSEDETNSSDECRDALNASNETIDADISIDGLSDDAEIECQEMENDSMLNITIETNESSDDGTTVSSEVRTIVWDTENESVVSHSVMTSSQHSETSTSSESSESNVSMNQSSTVVTGEESVDIDRGDVVAEDGEDGEDGEVNVSTG